MARMKQSLLFTGILLAVLLMPDFLRAGPVGHQEEEEVAEAAENKPEGSLGLHKLVRNRRSIAYYKQLPEFWAWYKYYVDTHNQEGIENMDRLYLLYLQNKHRVEEGSYNHYLTHLSEVYKACAKSDDPDCIPEYTSKPTAKVVMPAALKQAPICNPYLDPYCLYSVAPEAPAPASVKSPGPILTPMLPMPMYAPSGYHYYAPLVQPFLSAEQQAELLRVCNPSDVECLQYHLRAAYGYRPALTPVSPLAMVAKTPAGGSTVFVNSLKSSAASFQPECHPYDPNCNRFSPPAPIEARRAMTAQDDIILPHPDCDPEIDYNCRLRRAHSNANKEAADEPQEKPVQQTAKVAPRFEDFLRGYMGYYKK